MSMPITQKILWLNDNCLRTSISDFAWLEVQELLRHPFFLH